MYVISKDNKVKKMVPMQKKHQVWEPGRRPGTRHFVTRNLRFDDVKDASQFINVIPISTIEPDGDCHPGMNIMELPASSVNPVCGRHVSAPPDMGGYFYLENLSNVRKDFLRVYSGLFC